MINYDKTKMNRIEDLQNETLKQMLKMNTDAHKPPAYALTNLPSIRNRIHTMKINFFLKLHLPKANSLSHEV